MINASENSMDESLEDIKIKEFTNLTANLDQDVEDTGSICLSGDVSSTDSSSWYSLPESSKVSEHFIPGHDITAEVIEVERMPRTHPFNPNLYTIKLQHCGFEWTIKRRYKHFLKLDAELFLLKIDPRRQRIPIYGRAQEHLPSRHLPHRPDPLARTSNMENRKKAIEKYLQNILRNKVYRNHKETLNFLEVSQFSFSSELGGKGREGVVKKSSGGHRFSPGCCSCCSALSCGNWSQRWLIVKDSFVAYMNPRTKAITGVILIDRDFTFKHGSKDTKVRHGIVIRNEARELLLSCWTYRKANEWMRSIINVMATSGAEWMHEQPYGSFAPVRQGSFSRWFVDGSSYFDAVANAIDEAKDEIFIAGWWVSPELHLKRPITHGNRWRLDQLLKRKAESGVKVYVLVYKEVEMALTINSAYTKAALTRLHPNIKVMRHPDHVPVGSGILYWAHHEKIVSVDQKITFLGGLDLCFGRWDRPSHRLTDFGSAAPSIDKYWHLSNTEHEIGRIGELGGILLKDAIDSGRDQTISRPHLKDEVDGGTKLWIGKDYSNPIKRDFFAVHKPMQDSIDREVTARMPWHDIGVVVYGSPARDAARHFILRWNATKREKVRQINHIPYLMPKCYSNPHLNDRPSHVDTVDCQILRSIGTWSGGIPTETSILQAYLDTIHNAKHYIYIENQFFITSLSSENVRNEVGEALIMRIERAHREESNFRVIVVMPLLPAFEGEIGTPSGTSIGAIIHWNYRSICRGRDSLLERLSVTVGDPFKYISFYSLRLHSEIYGKPITELVYVHSKMLIADDDTVIIGSANINDRSLLGRRDSEIAVIVKDTETIDSTMDGHSYQAGKFAHSLRTTLFREHLGLPITDDRVDDPVCKEFYQELWMATASKNTDIYEKVFHCLPSDKVKTYAHLISYKNRQSQLSTAEQRRLLQGVQGHLVQHPLHFMEGENLRPSVGTSEYLVSQDVFT